MTYRSYTRRLKQTIDVNHMRALQGLAFTTELIDEALAGSGVLEILFETPGSAQVHVIPQATTGGEGKLECFEGVTVSDPGSPMVLLNRFRDSLYTARSIVTNAPTTTDDGTLLDTAFIPGGSGGVSIGGGLPSIEEWTMLHTTLYCFRLTNLSAQAKLAMLRVEWFEIPPDFA